MASSSSSSSRGLVSVRSVPAPAAAREWSSAKVVAGMLALMVAAAVASYVLATDSANAAAIRAADPDLVRLLRGMALIKIGMCACAAAGVLWRLRASPIGVGRFAAYGLACAAMSAGPAFIWNMEALRAGAALVHGGLLAAIVVLWTDPAVSARLTALLAARRARLATRE